MTNVETETKQARVRWRNLRSGGEGFGAWTGGNTANAWVAYGNEKYGDIIAHWVEYR